MPTDTHNTQALLRALDAIRVDFARHPAGLRADEALRDYQRRQITASGGNLPCQAGLV